VARAPWAGVLPVVSKSMMAMGAGMNQKRLKRLPVVR